MQDPDETSTPSVSDAPGASARGDISAPLTEPIVTEPAPTSRVASATEVTALADLRTIEVGTVLSNRYLIERTVGSGGMSTVFSALDRHRMHGPAGDAMVAVKVLNRALLSDKGRVQRLIREFRYMQRLTHRGIVRVFDLDCDEGTWFIIMELLQGQPLTEYLHRHQPEGLPADDALRLLTEFTEALVCAHDYGVIHGDFKPGNIFVDEKGRARLLDFGSVPEKDEAADAPRDRFLTPAYASPQMLEQQPADLRDDLYSLGCVAYELFTGQHPFKSMSSVEAREEGLRLNWVPSIPARHFGVIARMLSWERDDRPANGREFLDSLTAAQVRAKAAYTREPRPVDPTASASHSQRSRKPAATRAPEHKSQSERHESRSAATPEELSRAFAQFSGVVPDGWVGGEEHLAAAPVPPTGATDEATAPTRPPAVEPAKERFSKAIPPEWLEPKPKLEEAATPVQSASAAPAEDAADEIDAPSRPESTVAAKRAVPWLSQLRWNNARVLSLVRRSSRATRPSVAATTEMAPVQEVAPGLDEPRPVGIEEQLAKAQPRADDKAPALAHPSPHAKRSPSWQLRSSTPVSWSALASRFRTLRVRATSRAVAPALGGLSNAVVSAPTHLAHSGWVPQLQWRNEIAIRWADVQAASAAVVTPHVHIGTLPSPAVILAPSTEAAPIHAPSIAATPMPKLVAWRRAMANVSRTASESRDKLRANAARVKPKALFEAPAVPAAHEVAPKIAPIAAAPESAAAVATVPATPRQPLIDWQKLATNAIHVSAQSFERLRAAAARQRQKWPKEFSLLPHWMQLRRAIESLAAPREATERLSLSERLSQRVPRWREAVPATAIAGIAFIAWGLLQVSAASRSDAQTIADNERLAALRLQRLAEAPIDMTMPVVADLAVPMIKVERAPAVPSAPGFISFQSARIHVGAGQQIAVVNLRRNKSTNGSAPFGWRIAPGTARPGVDYEQPKIQMARFNDGQDVRSVFIPIKPAKAGGRPERRFTIQLTKTPGGPAFGDITEAEVVIEGSG